MCNELKKVARALGCEPRIIGYSSAERYASSIVDMIEYDFQEPSTYIIKINIDTLRTCRFNVLVNSFASVVDKGVVVQFGEEPFPFNSATSYASNSFCTHYLSDLASHVANCTTRSGADNGFLSCWFSDILQAEVG